MSLIKSSSAVVPFILPSSGAARKSSSCHDSKVLCRLEELSSSSSSSSSSRSRRDVEDVDVVGGGVVDELDGRGASTSTVRGGALPPLLPLRGWPAVVGSRAVPPARPLACPLPGVSTGTTRACGWCWLLLVVLRRCWWFCCRLRRHTRHRCRVEEIVNHVPRC